MAYLDMCAYLSTQDSGFCDNGSSADRHDSGPTGQRWCATGSVRQQSTVGGVSLPAARSQAERSRLMLNAS